MRVPERVVGIAFCAAVACAFVAPSARGPHWATPGSQNLAGVATGRRIPTGAGAEHGSDGGNDAIPPAVGPAEMRAVVEELLRATPYDLPGLVSRRLAAVGSKTFFLTVAAMSDEAAAAAASAETSGDSDSGSQRVDQVALRRVDALAALAQNAARALEALAEKADEAGGEAASVLEGVLRAAAEADGEFYVPLSPHRRAAMRAIVGDRIAELDDGFLTAVFAFTKHSNETGLVGMVEIMQAVLQLYAARSLVADATITAASEVFSVSGLLDKVLMTDPAAWIALVKAELGRPDAVCNRDGLLGEVQRRVETKVFELVTGSHAQRVQAEFICELTARISNA